MAVTPMGSAADRVEQAAEREQDQRRQQIGPMDGPEVEHGDKQRRHGRERCRIRQRQQVQGDRTHHGQRRQDGTWRSAGAIIGGTASRAGRIRQGRRRHREQGHIVQARPVDERPYAQVAAARRPRSARPPGRAGSRPPRPEVSTRSPMAKPGLSGRKRRTRQRRVVALQQGVVARALHHDRDARVEVGDQQRPRAARARRRSPGRPDPPGSWRACPWRRPARPRRRAGAPARTRRRNRRRRARSAARPDGRASARPASAAATGSAPRAAPLRPASRAAAGSPRAGGRSPHRRPGAPPTLVEARRAGDDRAIERRPAPATTASVSRSPTYPASRMSALPKTRSIADRTTSSRRAPSDRAGSGAGSAMRGHCLERAETSPSSPGAARRQRASRPQRAPASEQLSAECDQLQFNFCVSTPCAARCAASTSPPGSGRCLGPHRSRARRRG